MPSGIKLIVIASLYLLSNTNPGVSLNEYCGEAEQVWPRYVNVTVINSQNDQVCPSAQELEGGFYEIHDTTRSLVRDYAEATQNTFSCGGTPGWRRVVLINMTDMNCGCPPGLNLRSFSDLRTCRRANTRASECSSTIFSTGGEVYSKVCGRIRGYQFGSNHAFYLYSNNGNTLEEAYLDGVSLTHGPVGSRQHIWSFAGTLGEVESRSYSCPCDQNTGVAPPFIGNDFFCESGVYDFGSHIIYSDDPLWDGQGCSTGTCCEFNTPPWFVKELPGSTTDDIELRVCALHASTSSDVPLDLIELYVQ